MCNNLSLSGSFTPGFNGVFHDSLFADCQIKRSVNSLSSGRIQRRDSPSLRHSLGIIQSEIYRSGRIHGAITVFLHRNSGKLVSVQWTPISLNIFYFLFYPCSLFVCNVIERLFNSCRFLEKPFTARLAIVRKLLKEDSVPTPFVIEQLGHSVSALDAVPMALFCALRALRPIPEIPERENPFERTVIYAVSMGGDTDTIASMAAAVTGALCGVGDVPPAWIKMCEASDVLLALAEALFVHAVKPPHGERPVLDF